MTSEILTDARILRNLLRAVTPAMGRDPNVLRYHLLRFHVENNVLSVTATDGARLHHATAQPCRNHDGTLLYHGSAASPLFHACVAAMAGRRKAPVTLLADRVVTHRDALQVAPSLDPFPNVEKALGRPQPAETAPTLLHFPAKHLADAMRASAEIGHTSAVTLGGQPGDPARFFTEGDERGISYSLTCVLSASRL